jgi:hypothetical protein
MDTISLHIILQWNVTLQRFIFNRVILETASVRCAAVSALAKLGMHVPALTANG